MGWLSAGNVIAVLTALIGLVASFAAVWYERRPRRRLIGYRVQMAIRVGNGSRRRRTQAAFGLLNDLPGISDASLVLLRIENYGAQSIVESDYTNSGPYGLTVDAADLFVRSVVVIPDAGQEHLLGHFTDPDSISYRDSSIQLPRVPLNPGQHYKLLVLLDGDGSGDDIRMRGGIRDGGIVETESISVDDRPPKFSRPARLITVLLTACVVILAAIILLPGHTRGPVGCATGALTVAGSTAFAPVAKVVADRYEADCPGSTITVAAQGSEAGLRDVAVSAPTNLIAVSDGRVNEGGSPDLWGQAAALSTFALVVNDQVGVRNLTPDQIRRIFSGGVSDWSGIDPGARGPIQVLSRTTDSGSRMAFDRLFVSPSSQLANSTAGCTRESSPDVEFCLLASTNEVVSKVAAFPGAIGFVDLRAARKVANAHTVAIDGHQPSIHDSAYPFTEVEYAYTHGRPAPGSLVDSFLNYLITGPGRSNVITDDDQPCYTPDNLPRCRG
ncbi:PstS family phosphate ABC transporter substrate-binding protein [Frankia sp. AgKG'84/4]|uniref:PstS family phosphate ABC transporter substrate-binding protein n=1 Tax=Frankia sp. AgKG'84/4 TaxID=573490 RepID=UPI00200CA64E|nr:substrate-binding domain-containing protein [Frankia sp. AgKG'84/4]MCL9793426.1 substrate-binding domain-containing protein [Frankia sp. AgKG'84/4]